MEKEIRTVLSDIRGMLVRYEYAIPWIKQLKENGYQVLVLSNFAEKSLRDCWHELDFLPHVDGGILSFRDKVIKPDPAIYELLLERYQLKASECVFIDDLQKNVDAAKAQGFYGIQFKNQAQAVRELEALGVICKGSC